ncbi:four-jointed box protein 1 [Protopterus annectens]|uniref:four-jointed box protein 1 n=1 Tax=Protopterus annectens TaxID=7888 RepID=UPI001CF961AA|nr:four-jointed box protein 1 [Protopterus annectens]
MKIWVAQTLSAALLLLLVLGSVLLIWTGGQQRILPESKKHHVLRRALMVTSLINAQVQQLQTLPSGPPLHKDTAITSLAVDHSDARNDVGSNGNGTSVAFNDRYQESRKSNDPDVVHLNVKAGAYLELDDAVEDGIFWNSALDALTPSGFSDYQVDQWSKLVRGSSIVSLQPGCGRAPNRLARLQEADNTGNVIPACVRYGINTEQIVGETLSFYLSRLLGIENVPPLALAKVGPSRALWRDVAAEQTDAQWVDGALVSVTKWVANLSEVVTPAPLRSDSGWRLHPSWNDWGNRTTQEVLELIQWTDLIIFDYLTANFDRLVSNLFSKQWDPRIMERATSNLHRTPGGSLLFIDNEAGLLHGYRVKAMWDKYHEPLLKSVCIFRRRTASKVIELHRLRNAAQQLCKLYQAREPLHSELGFMSELHAQELQNRIDLLYKHILHCKSTYGEV